MDWTSEINELEAFFNSVTLPKDPVKLYPHSTITDLPLFIRSHLTMVRSNNGSPTFLPYLTRLRDLKVVLLLYIVQ